MAVRTRKTARGRVYFVDFKDDGGRRRRRDTRAAASKAKVPAFRFDVFAVVQVKATDTLSVDFIKKNLQDPLEQWLQTADVSQLPKEVSLGTGQPGLDNLFYDPEKGSGGVSQEGWPFYGAPLTWYIGSRPEPREEEVTEEN